MAHLRPAAFLLLMLVLPLGAGEEKSAKASKQSKPVIAVYNLEGPLSESGKEEPDMLSCPIWLPAAR